MRPLAESHVLNLSPYIPGKPIKETSKAYGLSHMVKLASNENCYGPSSLAVEAIKKAVHESHIYPNDGRLAFKEKICEHHNGHQLQPRQIVFGNGSNELITLLVRSLVGPKEALLNAWPSFVCYRLACRAHGRTEVTVPLNSDFAYDLPAMAHAIKTAELPIKLVFIANPNNPTGRYVSASALDAFMKQVPEDVVVVLDEAYAEYVEEPDYPDGIDWVNKRPRTVALRTFSKIHGLAGLRVGYAVADPDIAEILHKVRDPFNLNALGMVAAVAAIDDKRHVDHAKEKNLLEREKLSQELRRLGFRILPGAGNFLLATGQTYMPSMEVICEQLLRMGVIIRSVSNYGLPQSARITVGTQHENAQLIESLNKII